MIFDACFVYLMDQTDIKIGFYANFQEPLICLDYYNFPLTRGEAERCSDRKGVHIHLSTELQRNYRSMRMRAPSVAGNTSLQKKGGYSIDFLNVPSRNLICSLVVEQKYLIFTLID